MHRKYTYVAEYRLNIHSKSVDDRTIAGLTAALRYTAESKELPVAFFKHD